MTQTVSEAAPGPAPPEPSKNPRNQAIGKMTAHLARSTLSRGDTAPLRRMDPEHPHEPAFILFMLEAGAPESWTWELEDARSWALIVHAMALMAPHHHDRGTSVGAALHRAGVSDQRVARLLAARGVQFRKQMGRLVRRLAQAVQPVNWLELADLITAEAGDADRLDRLRLRIARDYYSAQFKARNAPSKDAP